MAIITLGIYPIILGANGDLRWRERVHTACGRKAVVGGQIPGIWGIPNWLAGQDRSLYLPAGRDRIVRRGPGTAPYTSQLVLRQETVWYLRCGNWNGMTSPPP